MKPDVQAYPHGSPFTPPNNFRRAAVRRVIDGDTAEMDIHKMGTDWCLKEHCRFARINAPEMSTPQGPPAKAHLQTLVETHGCDLACVVECLKRDEYGRLVICLWSDDGSVNLNDKMVSDGFAKVLEDGKALAEPDELQKPYSPFPPNLRR